MANIMKTFKFEIQNCINFNVVAKNKEEARQILVDNPDLYKDELSGIDCYISEGIKIENERL